MTGRFGHDACLRYLCSKLTKEQIDHTSGGLDYRPLATRRSAATPSAFGRCSAWARPSTRAGRTGRRRSTKCISASKSMVCRWRFARVPPSGPVFVDGVADVNARWRGTRCAVVDAVDNGSRDSVDLAMASVTNRETANV